MTPLSQVIRAFARTNQLVCTEGHPPNMPSVHLYDLRAQGNCCCVFIRITVDEEQHRTVVSVSGSPRAPRVRVAQVTRLVVLANEGDTFGRFSVDGASGAVFYATSAPVDDIALDAEDIEFAVHVAGNRYERLYPGLIEVINADADPDKLWPVIERPDWERINAEYNSLRCRPAWEPPDDDPMPHGILQLTDFAGASHTGAARGTRPITSTNGGIV